MRFHCIVSNIGEIQLVEEVDGAERSVRVELKVAEHGYTIGYLPKKQVDEAFNVIDIYANSVMTLSSKTNLTGGEWKMAIDAVDEMQYLNDPNAQNRALPDYGAIDTPLKIKTGKKSYEEVDGAERSVRVELKVAEHGYTIGYLPKKQVDEAFNVIDIYANSVMTLSSKTNLTGGEWKMAIDAVDEMQYLNDPNAQNRALPDYGAIDTPLKIKTGKKSYFLQFTLYEMEISNDEIPLYSLVDTVDGQRGSIVEVDAGPISYVIDVQAGPQTGSKITVIPEQIDRVSTVSTLTLTSVKFS
ncbi:hypothetical protein WP50_00765 [Lactiplantibacillus plantarum]|nr:hypothetical protein WP50_00765 [Lactiplantibacillus plantarum]